MRQNFELCLAAIFEEEGGYADLPGDPGGATNMGITRATLSAVRGRKVSKEEVMMLERDEAARIYRRNYWDAIGGDDLPGGLDLALFDDAVNSGPCQAIRDLQHALGVEVDGILGPRTKAAMDVLAPGAVIVALGKARRARLVALPTFARFGRGWTRRIARIEQQARTLIKKSPATNPETAAARPADTNKQTEIVMTNTNIPDSKPFWASQTIWSSIAVIGSSLGGAFLAWKSNDIAGFGAALTAVLGGVNAIIGRVRSTSTIR
jgi:lysozyme family protein